MKEAAEKLIKFWLSWYNCDYYIANITEYPKINTVDFLINEMGSMYHLEVHHTEDDYMVVENKKNDVLLKIESHGIV